MKSELINDRHLARCALVYIRQSSPHQVLTNQESLRLQYDLRRRALDLGWREEDVEVIDADLGLSGAGAHHREGFKDLIARVTLGQVGLVLSYEVTRLSRSCTDWYPLLDLCGFKDCLIGDRDSIYDPGSAIPRDGEALLHGIVHCGACGHKMVVQYKGGTRYLCNYLRQQHGTPVCQYILAGPIDAEAVAAFFQALAPAELDVYAQALAARRETADAMLRAQAQQVERLRYRAALAERQFDQVDPDNRLVAAELERRWEEALRDARQAETALAKAQAENGDAPVVINDKLRAAFTDAGRRLPELWRESALTTARKKALLRCLIDKVVIHRAAPDTIHMRIVWHGGDASALDVPVPVGSLAALSRHKEMEDRILDLARAGRSDEAIAGELTAIGHRSPMRDRVLPSTVRNIRLQHGILQKRSQSHPRRVPGCLTVPQLAAQLDVTTHWIYDRINNGTIAIARDERTGLYLFPDHPNILAKLQELRAGEIERLAFDAKMAPGEGHQDA